MWGGDSVIAEYTSAGWGTPLTWTKSYVYAGTRLLMTAANNGADGIPKGVGEGYLGRRIRGIGSSGFTGAPRILSAKTGIKTLKVVANFAKKWTGPIAIASAAIDTAAIGTCYVWR